MIFIPYGTNEATPRLSFPYVNILLVVANVAAFILEVYVLLTFGQAGFARLLTHYAFVPVSLSSNWLQISLITSLFLHAGLLHVAGNLLYLLPFGDNVEDRLGHLRYLFFYLVCGIAANLVFALFNQRSAAPLLGASGAIAGVLGGYLALNPTGSSVKGFLWIIVLLIRIRLPALLFIGYWFIMQLFSTVASLGTQPTAAGGGVAFLAHVGGFITGLVLAPLLARRTPARAASTNSP